MSERAQTADIRSMIYRRRRTFSHMPGGHFNLQNQITKTRMHGFGHGEHISLRDEFGYVWKGWAEHLDDNSVRYTFKNEDGNQVSGVSDSFGVVLRHGKGKTWRGIVD